MFSVIETIPESQTSAVISITRMARHVDGMVDNAIEALLHGRTELAAALQQKETLANAMEMQIDGLILAALGKGGLTHAQVVQAVFMLKINKDLERMADLAANIGRRVTERAAQHGNQECGVLQPLAIAVSHMSRKTLRALARQDIYLAGHARAEGARVDDYRNFVLRQLREQPADARNDSAVQLLLAARYLEQIADHAANVAEKLVRWLDQYPHCSPASDRRVAV